MNQEEFKQLKDGGELFWRKGQSAELRGQIILRGDEWRINWSNGSHQSGGMDDLEHSDWWLSNISQVAPATPSIVAIVKLSGIAIPSGYESAGEFRIPTPEDCYLRSDGIRVIEKNTSPPKGPRLILRKLTPPWVAPKWMKPGCWLWSNDGNAWWLCDEKPQERSYSEGYFTDSTVNCMHLDRRLQMLCIDFTPPPFTDWKSSLRQIPEHGATA